MKKEILNKVSHTRDKLNALVNDSSCNLTNIDIITLSQELDELIVKSQLELNKNSTKLH